MAGGGFKIYMKIKYYNKILLLIMIQRYRDTELSSQENTRMIAIYLRDGTHS